MKRIISLWLITLSFVVLSFGQSPQVKTKDLQVLTGARWTGNLAYLDYGTEKKVLIPSDLIVRQAKDGKLSWVFEYQYPDEPKANSTEIVAVSKDGKMFDGEMVIERTNLTGKTVKVVTEKSGSDNDKKALFRFTYLLSKKSFSIRKEVKYEGATEFFVRSEYNWKR